MIAPRLQEIISEGRSRFRIATLQTMCSALPRLTGACAAGETGPCPIIAAFNPEPAGTKSHAE
jgi:hypothetical protein